MSQWNHPICDDCWAALEDGRRPYRLTEPEIERCCWCGSETTSGIYRREDPAEVPEHRDHGELP